MTKEDMAAMSWALNGNHLKVYPVRTKENYNVMVTNGGKARKASKCYVKLCIEIGNGIGTQRIGTFERSELRHMLEQIDNKVSI